MRPITLLTFLILISFFLIVVVPYHIDYNIKDATSILRGGNRGRRKPPNFDQNFHRILQKSFPDVQGRIEYEKKQRHILNSAQKKLKTPNPFFSKEEKDAIAYFEGTGFYHYYQHVEKKPNIYDTRKTFLLKMHDPQIRKNFLDALIRNKSLQDNFSEKTSK